MRSGKFVYDLSGKARWVDNFLILVI
jgi:hypothetical protein